jgi:hypothetical protein
VALSNAPTPAPAAAGDGRQTERLGQLDAVNGVVLIDDSLVVEIMAIKCFGIDPKVVLTVTPLPAQASNRRGP